MQNWKLNDNTAILAGLEIAAKVDNDNKAVVMVKGYGEDSKNYTAIYLHELAEHQKEGGTFSDWIGGWKNFELWFESDADALVQSTKIRLLNDDFRRCPANFHVTAGIVERGQNFVESAANLVRTHSEFESGNDPYKEHDFGVIMVYGTRVFWKIDYYDLTLKFGSENPADPKQTKRVLTIMLAHEY